MQSKENAPAGSGGPLGQAHIYTVLLFVHDFDGMLAFYRDTLGLRVGYASDMFAELSAGGGAGISLHKERGPAVQESGNTMIEFRVAEIEAVVEELRRRGVTVEPIRDESFGKIASFLDPEGHRIGLEEPRPRAGRLAA